MMLSKVKKSGKTVKLLTAIALSLSTLLVGINPVKAQDSNRQAVRNNISKDGWYVVWGETINEAEYLKLTAAIAASVGCECTAPIQGYFENYYARTTAKVKRNAPAIGQQMLEDLIVQAFDDPGRILSYNGVQISANVATYNRWKRVVYDEPYTYKCKWKGPLGTWTWGVCNGMKRKEKTVSLPNWHQPYIRFRFTSANSGSTASNSQGYNFHFTNNCQSPVRLAVRYRNMRGEWVTGGWWSFAPAESAFLSTNGVRLASDNSIFYYYAEALDSSGSYWGGNDLNTSFSGKRLNMRKKQDKSGHNNWSIGCSRL